MGSEEFGSKMTEAMSRAGVIAGYRIQTQKRDQQAMEWAIRAMKVFDVDSNGVLSMQEFNTVYNFIPGLDPKGAPDAFMGAKPQDGYLDTEGLGRFLASSCRNLSDEEFDQAACEVMRGAADHASKVADQRKKVPEQEIGARVAEWSSRLFQIVDIDGNGTVDADEFAVLHRLVPNATQKGLASEAFADAIAVDGGERLGKRGFARFLEDNLRGCTEVDFNHTMTSLMQHAAEASNQKMQSRQMSSKTERWAKQLLSIFDVDSNGWLNQEEFISLYGCVPGADPAGARRAYTVAAAGETQRSPGGCLGVEGLAVFLQQSLWTQSIEEFESAMLQMKELASKMTEAKRKSRKEALKQEEELQALVQNCDSWARRLLKVFDVDGNGVVDRGEFSVLYDCVPGVAPEGQQDAFNAVCTPSGVVTEAGLSAFLQSSFAGKPAELEVAVSSMMERGSMISGTKLAQREAAAKSPTGAADWARRVLQVFDVDGNGVMDQGEFNILYDCANFEPQSPQSTFSSVAHNGVVTQDGLTRFLKLAFSGRSQEDFHTAITSMMQRGAMISGAKLSQRQASADIEAAIFDASTTDYIAESQMKASPPPAPALPPAVDPAQIERMDAVLPKLFERYDSDCSGKLNTPQELQQLTINLTFNLGLHVRPDKLQRLVGEIQQPILWSPQDFRVWYVETVLTLP